MIEKILLMFSDSKFAQQLADQLKKFGCEVIHSAFTEPGIPFGELAARYNIIIVDKQFCGNSLRTATLIRRLRKEFYGPIIGIETMFGDGSISLLQVSGCNWILQCAEFDTPQINSAVCRAVQDVSSLLEEIQP
ncbi:MAG TPA: hypothetical protein VMV71_02540 [Candidatus Paceibacterota bacterium]|nr:hypothetical protein [Candidatus Paceibacterota bacterium]